MSHSIYCDLCGRESDPDVQPYEEQEILPGPAGDDHPRTVEFVILGEHRKKTGDRIWCMPCWVEVTTREISGAWKDAYFEQKKLPALGHVKIQRRSFYPPQSWGLRQCRVCGDWLEIPERPPIVPTTIYSVLLEEAGKTIDGWFFGVLFKQGKITDVRCPTHMTKRTRKAA